MLSPIPNTVSIIHTGLGGPEICMAPIWCARGGPADPLDTGVLPGNMPGATLQAQNGRFLNTY